MDLTPAPTRGRAHRKDYAKKNNGWDVKYTNTFNNLYCQSVSVPACAWVDHYLGTLSRNKTFK